MVRQRRPVQTLQEAIQVQPQAGPVGGDGVTAAPLHLPIYDFAPISQTVTSFLAHKARKDAAKKSLEGERFVLDNPSLVSDMEQDAAKIKDPEVRAAKLKEAFAFLQRSGKIVPAGDPYWQVGYSRAAGRMLAGAYRDRLSARLAEVSTVRDGDNNPVPAPDVDAIIAEEWEKVRESPAVQDFYGGQEALGLKAQVDEEFRSRSSLQRAQAQERDYNDMLTSEIGSRFDAILAQNPVVTSESLQSITDFLGEEVLGHNVMDPRGLTMQALELSIQRLASIDGDEAVRAVHAAQDLVVGGVRLGDDRGPVGLRLQDLTRRVREEAKSKDMAELQGADVARRLAIQQGEAEYVPMLLKAKQEGANVGEVARKLSAQYLADETKFKGQGAFVAESVQDFARQIDAARVSDGSVLDEFNILVADGQLDTAEALVQASLGAGSLTGEDYARATDTLRQRKDVSPFVEQSGIYQAVRGRYNETKPAGMTAEVQQGIDDQVVDLQRRLERDFSAFVRTTSGKPNREELHRAWLAERELADLTTIRTMGGEIRIRRDELVKSIRERSVRYQDSADMIDQGVADGTLTVLEGQAAREDNIAAVAGRERFFQSEAFREAEAEIDRQFQEVSDPAAPEAVAALGAAKRRLRDQYTIALDALLADPAANPTTFEPRARAEVQRVLSELGTQLFPETAGAKKRAAKAVESGASAEGAISAGKDLEEDRARAQIMAAVIADPRQRESFSSAMFPPNPTVPVSFYDAAARWMSGKDPIFGSPTTREQVLDKMTAGLSVMSEDVQAEAAAGMLAVVGVAPQDVLRGRVELERGPSASVMAEIESLQAGLRAGIWLRPAEVREQIAGLRARLSPISIDLTAAKLPPYTTPFFRSKAALDAWQRDPGYAEFLARIGIDAEDDAAIEQWLISQRDATVRTNP